MTKAMRNMFRGDAKVREQFIAQVQRDFAFLFTDHAAEIVANDKEYPPMFDNAIITVVVDNLRFRFVQERGEHRVDVAPCDEPEAWETLDYALMAIDREEKKPSWVSFQELAKILKAKLVQLENAFSRKEYSATSQRLAEIHDRERKQWVTAFNDKG